MRFSCIGAATAVLVITWLQCSPSAAQDFNGMLRRFLQYYSQAKATEAMAEAQSFEKAAKRAFGTRHTNYGVALNHLGMAHTLAGKLEQAEGYYLRALGLWERTDGKTSDNVGRALSNLIALHLFQGRHKEVAEGARRAIGIFEKNHGREHPLVGAPLSYLGQSLLALGEYDQAEPVMRRTLEIGKIARPPNLPALSAAFESLAGLYWKQGRYKDAEHNFKEALAVRKRAFGEDHPYTGETLHNLGLVQESQGRYPEAAALFQQAADIAGRHKHVSLGTALLSLARIEISRGRYTNADALCREAESKIAGFFGPEHPSLAVVYSLLGNISVLTGRFLEGEQYFRRSLALYEKSAGVRSQDVARELNNIAVVFAMRGKKEERVAYLDRALKLQEEVLGPNHTDVSITLSNIGHTYFDDGNYVKADAIYRRVLQIREKNLGESNLKVADAARALAVNDARLGRLGDAELHFKRVLAIYRQSHGDDHPALADIQTQLATAYRIGGRLEDARASALAALSIVKASSEPWARTVLSPLNELAIIEELAGNSELALEYARKDHADRQAHAASEALSAGGAAAATIGAQDNSPFRVHLGILASVAAKNGAAATQLADEAFVLAQDAVQSHAGLALQQMALRFGLGGGRLSQLVRESQDLVSFLRDRDKVLIEALSVPKHKRSDELVATVRSQTAAAEARLAALTTTIGKEFPDYAALASPTALRAEVARKLLGPDEVLLFWLTGSDASADPAEKEQSHVFALTREAMVWRTIPLGIKHLEPKIAALRKALADPRAIQRGLARAEDEACALRGLGRVEGKADATCTIQGFDAALAHELYRTLLGPVEALVKDKAHLIVVPSGALTGLPFQVLLTALPTSGGLREAPWLLKRHAISVLPSVPSLKALRVLARGGRGTQPFIGFGDPVFDQTAAPSPPGGERRKLADAEVRAVPTYFRGHLADPKALASLVPLADTADELRLIAKQLGVPESEIVLGRDASESRVKALSAVGRLGTYRIVHFATHGLVAGDLKGLAEPALALSAPESPTEHDDGLLTASEAAALKLNADWVVLSACNTAAGDRPGAEALSGLARAFFYAGARALLVSHWPVESAAAVKLTTATFAELTAHPAIGRAEALRRAMLALMADPTSHANAHPAIWAPFMVVGEGGIADGG